jgi:hypothetical protein
MTIDDLVSLTKAGFTKDDITRFLTPAPAPVPGPVPSEPPAPAEPPAPVPSEPAPAPAEPASDGADLKALFENYLQKMQDTLSAIQSGNIRNDGQPPKTEENPFIKYLP